MKILAEAGHVFHGPDGQGYRLTADVRALDPVTVNTFEAFGGAPEPKGGTALPSWLAKQIAQLGSHA